MSLPIQRRNSNLRDGSATGCYNAEDLSQYVISPMRRLQWIMEDEDSGNAESGKFYDLCDLNSDTNEHGQLSEGWNNR